MRKKDETIPSADRWLREAKAAAAAADCGMFLLHNGVVRRSAKARVRAGDADAPDVRGMRFSYDREKAAAAIREAEAMEGIRVVRVWLNEGELAVGTTSCTSSSAATSAPTSSTRSRRSSAG